MSTPDTHTPDPMAAALTRVSEAEARWGPIDDRFGYHEHPGAPPMPDFELNGPVTPEVIDEWASDLHEMADSLEARLDREEAEEDARNRDRDALYDGHDEAGEGRPSVIGDLNPAPERSEAKDPELDDEEPEP